MKDILDELKSVASIIIVDSAPVLVYADAIVLSGRLDGVIMVIQAGKSTRGAITQALFDLQNANANLLGSVFNQSPKSDTFSGNRAYMQERPQLSAPMALTKKAKVHAGPFEDLRDSAIPLNEKLEIPGLVREETAFDEVSSESINNDEVAELNSLDAVMDEGLEPEHKNEVAEFESLENDIETIDHSHEETSTEAGNVTVHEYQGQVAEQGNLETEVNGKLSGFQENAESQERQNRKRRSRKNKFNGSKNEAAAGNRINVPIANETDAQMDQISEPVDHDVVLVDRNKDE
jgi:hypothetical protein